MGLKYLAILILLLFIAVHPAKAQNRYQKGYIVTNSNDTLLGKVRDRNMKEFGNGIYEKIRFKGKGWKNRFGPEEITSYKIGDIRYRGFINGNEMDFYRINIEGYLNHYILEFQEPQEKLVEEYHYIQRGANGSLIATTNGVFGLKKKLLARILDDCPGLSKKILTKEFKHVSEVVNYYNDCKANF